MLMPKTLENCEKHSTCPWSWRSESPWNYLVFRWSQSLPHLVLYQRNQALVLFAQSGTVRCQERINNQTVHVHTGTIDNVWNMIKKSLPASLTTKDSKKPSCLNRKIWQHVRAWQWRWKNSTSHNLSHLTASTLMKSKEWRKKLAAAWVLE